MSSDPLWWRGHRIDGLSTQPGMIVLCSDQVVFLPTGASVNLLGAMVKGVGQAVSPVRRISFEWLRPDRDPLRMFEDLLDESASFAADVAALAESLGGTAWSRSEAHFARGGGSLTGRSGALVFIKGGAEPRGYAPRGRTLERLLSDWTEVDPPIAGEVLGMCVVSLLPLTLAGTVPRIPFF